MHCRAQCIFLRFFIIHCVATIVNAFLSINLFYVFVKNTPYKLIIYNDFIKKIARISNPCNFKINVIFAI